MAMGCATTIKRAGGRFRRGISVPAIGLVLAMAGWAWGQKPASDGWVGKPVVPKTLHFTIRVGTPPNERRGPPAIYHVEEARGAMLLVASPELRGWVSAASVVPLDQAVAHFTGQIQANPAESFNYAMRANALLAQKPDLDRVLSDLNRAVQLNPRDAFARKPRQCPCHQAGMGQGHRRPERRDQARPRGAHLLDRPGERMAGTARLRQGRRRLRSRHPAGSSAAFRAGPAGIDLGRPQRIRPGDRRLQRGHPS